MGALTLSASAHLWEQFLVGAFDGGPDARVEAHPILPRWQRSRALGAPSTGLPEEGPSVGALALVERRARMEPVWHEVRELLELLAATPLPSGRVALLADREGVILATRSSGGDFRDHADYVRLVAGACWDETCRGTNAIGTALVEGSAVAVVGPAHYAQRHHGLVCYAAPIHDPFGEAVGVLDVTGPASDADPLVLMTVASIAHSAEARLREVAWARIASSTRGALASRLSREDEPVLLLEAPGRIAHLNAAARRVLGAAPDVQGPTDRVFGLSWRALKEAALRGDTLEADLPGMAASWRVHAELVGEGAGSALALLVRLESRGARAQGPGPRATAPRLEGDAWAALKGDDPALRATLREAARYAPTSLPVLLLSETGTGKELLARAIHASSNVGAGPFVAVNCGALSSTLLESELFGHAPGAFTGARAGGADGKLAAADGGTLFLDELAEMPAALQVMLLRVLEDGSFSRVGESRVRHSRFRLVGATCRDLEGAVRDGSFRGDLYFRLQGAILRLPPLRERGDLPELVKALVVQLAQEGGHPPCAVSPAALARLQAHAWPGNVRELKTVLRLALVRAMGADVLDVDALPPLSGGAPPRHPVSPPAREAPSPVALRELEANAILDALSRSGGNVARAARLLGIARSTLYRMVERFGLSLPPRS
ncbi:sigma-54-dependent Fis family transcriptional regulator [Myxococcus stipitatus]|uniref:sigma-54-dependent Fis family transcriptional regulator n=1 Tax=Myxococcus stipitatus TaxID=83455 RepID=UPI001F380451|nr:sigma-54-dependent Fis family transcriptional regulator [Myxococcus stipitatus]MCE9668075.1 sigma-54-dependent Fis family transcriptional regulator [Myxococcus stipitatus]